MNVLLISQCSKNALMETRRILDQFAERRGERTWQTVITQQGLDTLRRLLRKNARKNTAVACHWIRGRDHSELLWIVGDVGQFNAQGAVPTNTTTHDVLRRHHENDWSSAEDIRLLATMASLFHDFGKASRAFQKKLRSQVAMADAYRHEWVSLRLFEAFVGGESDEEWLRQLANTGTSRDTQWLSRLIRDDVSSSLGPFAKGKLPPIAQAVGWLIVSHHRLPLPRGGVMRNSYARLPEPIVAAWNAALEDASAQEKAACWIFDDGLPCDSRDWRRRAGECARSMLLRSGFLAKGESILADPYVMHLSRLAVMLADHYYSSQQSSSRYGDPEFPLYANTDRKTRQCKQRLDEHLIGVASNARRLMRVLPRLEHQLPRIARHKGFKRRASLDAFRWQDKAFDLAMGLQRQSAEQGFFGINMASTGCGKTLANGRILYGLADPQRGARFSIALGLRTLTLQTGEAYRERLGLGDDELAVLVGGSAIRELFAHHMAERLPNALSMLGSESAADLLLDNTFVHYESSLDEGPLQRWLMSTPGANKLVNAPVLACTIDHLIPATESTRGGHQIAPMLRLLTSDLVLDEVDDFDIDDLPALTRLVHWAGLLGSRVLLSSATLPPALVQGLFDAYREGRKIFERHRGERRSTEICCAWFDEYCSEASSHATRDSYSTRHSAFVAERIALLRKAESRRRVQIQPVVTDGTKHADVCESLAATLVSWIDELHRAHRLKDEATGKYVSIGLVRFANIEPLIEVARALCANGAPDDLRMHLCVYHSHHPLLMRSRIEQRLDTLLKRHQGSLGTRDPLLDQWEVRLALENEEERNQVFIVLASPVAEVGRDHDYDWAIVEPSSMRSIIQLAGRIRRHRPGQVHAPNIYLMERNIKSLEGERIAYFRPGFESSDYVLETHGLSELLTPDQLEPLDSAPRIVERKLLEPRRNLVDLEHKRLRALLLAEGSPVPVSLWWETRAGLSGGLQAAQRFRRNVESESTYALVPDLDDPEDLLFHEFKNGEWSRPLGNLIEHATLMPGPRVRFWGATNYQTALNELAERMEIEPLVCAQRFGCVHLIERKVAGWAYHPALGFIAKK